MCRTESRQHENCQFRKIHTCDDHNFRPKTLSNRYEKAASLRNKFIPWIMIVLGFGESIFVYTLAFTEIRVCWYVSTFDHNFFSSLLVYISTHLVHSCSNHNRQVGAGWRQRNKCLGFSAASVKPTLIQFTDRPSFGNQWNHCWIKLSCMVSCPFSQTGRVREETILSIYSG